MAIFSQDLRNRLYKLLTDLPIRGLPDGDIDEAMFKSVLLNGWKGFVNFTDTELVEELAGYIDLENDDPDEPEVKLYMEARLTLETT